MMDIFNDIDLYDLMSNNGDEFFSIGTAAQPCGSSEWEEQVALSKRRRTQKKTVQDPLVNLRLLKSDIRRSYSSMLANVLNSCDFTLIFGFLDTFLTPNAFQVAACQFGPLEPAIVMERKQGVPDIFRFWCSNLHMIPDSIMHLQNTSVKVPVTGCGSKIVSSFKLEATSIYDTPFPGVPEGLAVDCLPDDSCCTTKVVKSVVEKVTDNLSKLSLRQNPMKIISEGRFILTIDDEKRITGVDMLIINNWNGSSVVT